MTKHMTHHYSKDDETHLEAIGDYMTSPVISISPNSSVREAAQLMHAKNIGSLFVEENEEFIGMVTESIISHGIVAEGLEPDTTRVSEVMRRSIPSLDCMESVEEANMFMARNKIRHLGVTKNGKIIGALSVKDLVSFFSNPRIRTW